jgi:hypothetical protein
MSALRGEGELVVAPGDHDPHAEGNPAVHGGLQDGDRRPHRAGQRHFGFGGLLPLGIPTLKPPASIVPRLLGFLVLRLRTL